MNDLPIASIIIPFRNEEKFIASCIESVLENDYPHHKMEIILVDGLSDDNSVMEINKFISKYPFIKIVSNPLKIFPAAVNLGIKNSTGSIIIILGAHAKYSKNYISRNIENIFKYKAENTGGILITIGQESSFSEKVITHVLTNQFGVGNSDFRTGSKNVKEVDTVFGGCYKRTIFDEIGMFNENLISTSDLDFNTRLKKHGGKIILDPEVKTTYYTRSTFSKFLKNNIRNGFWSVYPVKFLNYLPVKLRHLVPFFFFSYILTFSALGFLLSAAWYILGATMILYLLLAFNASLRNIKDGFHYFLIMPFFFLLLHFTYGLGSFIAMLKLIPSGSFLRFFNPAFYK